MSHVKKIDKVTSILLMTGTLLSSLAVLIGGTLYLIQHGNELINDSISLVFTPFSIKSAIHDALSYSPEGLIEIGILSLIFTQTLRVFLLSIFYGIQKDYQFLAISLYVLIALIYGFFR